MRFALCAGSDEVTGVPPPGTVRRSVGWCLTALLVVAGIGMAAGLVADSGDPVSLASLKRSFEVLPAASARIRTYSSLRTGLYWFATAWYLAGLALAVRTGIAERMLRRIPRLAGSQWWSAMVVWASLAIFMAVWRLPVALASTHVERVFGLSNIAPALWIGDRLRDLVLEVAWAPGVAVAWWLMRRSPRRWWLILALGLVPVGFLLTVVYPVFIDPLYNRFRPLEDGPLRTRILAMAERAGVRDPAVLVADHSKRTRKANAYVTGLGPTHRIVLWDTLLSRMPRDEVLAITAHELGHYRLGHIWMGLALYSAGGFLTLWALAYALGGADRDNGQPQPLGVLGDPRAIPLAFLALNLLLLAQTPLASAISRVMERQADAFGLALCGDGPATARSLASFSTDDLADPDPSRWLVAWGYTHPPLRERVARALAHESGDARQARPSNVP